VNEVTPYVKYIIEDDILYVRLSPGPIVRTADGGNLWRNVDYDASGNVVAVEFVNARDGVDLRGLPRQVGELLKQSGHDFPVLV
jgi:uncharacterized protein YuzE